ncbi:MAG: frr [Fibrobacteria bacterium]|jgi:ribosome recycling factor|nr:frr [Fibrobacteria bacterium]
MVDEPSLEARMQKSIDTLRKDFTKLRTGIASPAMLDNVFVDYYGTRTPLPQVAAISIPEPRTLAIKPWEKGLMQAIEKAIQVSDLGINPVNDGTYIRLNLPVLTGDRRKELAKTARKDGEEAKVAIRNIRREENDHLKKVTKDSGASEDDLKGYLDQVQKITDKYTAIIDQLVAEKEKDIMTV